MADLEAVLADVSYLMAMEKSKCTPAARASKKIILPDPRYALLTAARFPAALRAVRFAGGGRGGSDGGGPSVHPHVRRRTSPRFLPLPSSIYFLPRSSCGDATSLLSRVAASSRGEAALVPGINNVYKQNRG